MTSPNRSNTFYLTPEEDRRMRQTVQERLQKCKDTAGQPRVGGDYQTLRSTATQASLFADIMSDQKQDDSMVALAVGNTYPPCTVPCSDLNPMKLRDLAMDTHHRKNSLAVRRTAPVVVHKGRSWTIVQDVDSDEAERLEMVLYKNKAGEEILESAENFTIKEPYFTLNEQGEQAIIVNHPSDLVACSSDVAESGIAITAQKYKDKGNAALKKQELLDAHAAYSHGLKVASLGDAGSDMRSDLFRNRAFINLQLGRFDEAKADGIASVTRINDARHIKLDGKAYFRAGLAAYNAGDYQEAKRLFEEQLKLVPADKDGKTNLRRIEQRLLENAEGKYDFKRIKAGLSKARSRIDAAAFTKNVVIKDSPGAGRGLFAERDLKVGELVFCEKAFSVVWSHEGEAWTAMTYDVRDDNIRGFPAGLSKAMVQKMTNNPSQIPRVMDLFGDYKGIGKDLIMPDGCPVVDTFQVHDIICRNAFSAGAQFGEETVNDASTGLWVWTSYTNHNCAPNSNKEAIGDLMVVTAVRPIAKGEEILISYDENSDYDARQANLKRTWGFVCSCSLCKAEEADGPELRKKRRDLQGQAHAVIESEHPARAKRLTVVKARRLANSIRETYDVERYRSLPRTALKDIEQWLDMSKER